MLLLRYETFSMKERLNMKSLTSFLLHGKILYNTTKTINISQAILQLNPLKEKQVTCTFYSWLIHYFTISSPEVIIINSPS